MQKEIKVLFQVEEQDLEAFKESLINNEKSNLTIEKYMRDVRHFLVWLEGREITKAETLAYKAYLSDNYAISSVNSMISSLSAWLKYIGRSECCVKTLKVQRSVFCSERKELTKGEYGRLLQAAKRDKRLVLLMRTIAETGIRVSEHRFITVEAVQKGIVEVRCKGKIRTILLPRQLCKELLSYARGKNIGSGCVFRTRIGQPLNRSYIWTQMKKLCEAAKVIAEKVFPHNLRHLFARTFYSIEKDVVRLADILGHSSINTTRIYTIESGSIHRHQIEKVSLYYMT